MGKINVGRVVLGGLLAGLIINIGEMILNMSILGTDWADLMAKYNLPPMEGTGMIGGFIVLSFVLGIAAVWCYAAIRPRFNPGPKTAIIAGLAVWFFSYFYPLVGLGVSGLLPSKLLWVTLIWGIFEISIATQAGAWLYKEQ